MEQLKIIDTLEMYQCRINKFGFNTLPSKIVVIPYTCGLSSIAGKSLLGMVGCGACSHFLSHRTGRRGTPDLVKAPAAVGCMQASTASSGWLG